MHGSGPPRRSAPTDPALFSSSRFPDLPVIRPDAPVLLEIRDLHARVEAKAILKGVNLTIRAGEIHAVMGRNGSGKSTLS